MDGLSYLTLFQMVIRADVSGFPRVSPPCYYATPVLQNFVNFFRQSYSKNRTLHLARYCHFSSLPKGPMRAGKAETVVHIEWPTSWGKII